MSVTSALRDTTLLCVAWMCLLGTNAGNDPKYVWPFSNLTYAYDVIEGRDGKYSDKQKCPELEPSYPDFEYESFVFKGSGPSIEVELRKTKMDSITIAFFVYPYHSSGIIIDYKADEDNKADTISKLRIELTNGQIKVTMVYGINNFPWYWSPSYYVPLKNWTFIAFSKENEKFYLQVNWNSQEDTKYGIKFDADGEFNIGKYYEGNTYHGRISCLSFWDYKVTMLWDTKQWCSPQKWRRKTPYPPPQCAVQRANARVTHLWPLSLSSGGYNVVNNTQPTAPVQFQCSFTSEKAYSETNQTVIYLDGSIISYLQAIIPVTNANSDITVAISVSPDHQVEGVIWDIQIPASRDTDQSWRLRLSLADKFAVFEIRNATGTCSQVTTKHRIHGDGWYFLCAMLLFSNNTMSIFSKGELVSAPLGCKPNMATINSANIRVGQAHDHQPTTAGYHGSAACLAIVDGVADGPSIQVLVEKQCQVLDTQNRSVVNANCSNTGVKIRRYRMAAYHQCPSIDTKATSPGLSSLVTCSVECMNKPGCRSFAFRASNSTHNCQVYNFVTRSGLRAEHDCNYYCLAVD